MILHPRTAQSAIGTLDVIHRPVPVKRRWLLKEAPEILTGEP